MSDLILRNINPDQLRADIVRDVINAMRPLLRQTTSSVESSKCVTRSELATILGWSLSKVDRRTSDGAISSIMDDGRRTYVVDEVLATLKANTPLAEAKAAQRQLAKQAAKSRSNASATTAATVDTMPTKRLDTAFSAQKLMARQSPEA